jgi:putative tryptophan/tyrosine transport system substrate-binding protein
LSSLYTRAGALLSFDCDYVNLGRQTGEIALRLLNGENIAGIKEEHPKDVKISINLSVAERLGINFPAQVIKEAMIFGK